MDTEHEKNSELAEKDFMTSIWFSFANEEIKPTLSYDTWWRTINVNTTLVCSCEPW